MISSKTEYKAYFKFTYVLLQVAWNNIEGNLL